MDSPIREARKIKMIWNTYATCSGIVLKLEVGGDCPPLLSVSKKSENQR